MINIRKVITNLTFVVVTLVFSAGLLAGFLYGVVWMLKEYIP